MAARRFSQAIAEGDGISVLVEVDDGDAARAAQRDGAEALVVRTDVRGVRAASELPILWRSTASIADAARAGADACLVVVEELHEDDDRLERLHEEALSLGLDCVVEVRDEEELELALERLDPRSSSCPDARTTTTARSPARWSSFRTSPRASSPSRTCRSPGASRSTSSSGRESMRSSSEPEASPSSSATRRRRFRPNRRLAETRWGGPATALGALLALAAALRAVGIEYGLPFGNLLNPDEQSIVPRAWKLVHGGGGDPHWFDYPTLLMYLNAFKYNEVGYACAIAVMLAVVIFVLATAVNLLADRGQS